MDTAVYIVTVIVSVSWSVWLYVLWTDAGGLREESGFRLLWVITPSSYLLLLALSGWQQAAFIRLDLIGLSALCGLTVLLSVALAVGLGGAPHGRRHWYITVLALYNVVGVLVVGAAYLVRAFPPLLIRVSYFFREWADLDFFSFLWLGLSPETGQADLVGMLNKLFIALLSYLPITVLRVVYTGRQRRRLRSEIEELRKRLAHIEDTISHYSKT